MVHEELRVVILDCDVEFESFSVPEWEEAFELMQTRTYSAPLSWARLVAGL